ncbi:DUF3489 domain-containing protein [Roseovarius pacificus]|uniref:DUF3489 domain-containing protein n=1 Tax=Roseovarius pacificus TaxID=337701 RepID=UPI002A18B66C|nr:DUF3489 domain-containing protein [Roseovarius pacificus]
MTIVKPDQPRTGAKLKFQTRTSTKKDRLIRMLSGKDGADTGSISRKLGWQNHTTRAAMSGLRKAGFEIAATKPDAGKPTRYRITAVPKAAGDDHAG